MLLISFKKTRKGKSSFLSPYTLLHEKKKKKEHILLLFHEKIASLCFSDLVALVCPERLAEFTTISVA